MTGSQRRLLLALSAALVGTWMCLAARWDLLGWFLLGLPVYAVLLVLAWRDVP